MRINIDNSGLEDAKDVLDLAKRISILLSKLESDLQNQPDFIVITSDEQEVPSNTKINTVIFKFDETDVVKTGYYDGENLIIP